MHGTFNKINVIPEKQPSQRFKQRMFKYHANEMNLMVSNKEFIFKVRKHREQVKISRKEIVVSIER